MYFLIKENEFCNKIAVFCIFLNIIVELYIYTSKKLKLVGSF